MNTLKSISSNLKTSLLTKVIVILTLGFSIKLILSCTPHPSEPIEMNFNKIRVHGIDNSDKYLNNRKYVDTMYSNAVAFTLNLSDTTHGYSIYCANKALRTLSFAPAMATSISISYIPVNRVTQIKITTLLDIDDDIKAGDDITDIFLFENDRDGFLYKNINSAITKLNGKQSCASRSINAILTVAAKRPTLQLNFQVTLDNDIVLSVDTDVITILNPTGL
ncbi:MAG TPA: hypothetical protein PLY32_03400 [Salinivirgaceae bacterium]|nr:hypothetical protein [Salinivirgaceae bacterium]HQA76145.1 hypothetical protein [Salinivirgaceae bacterium]